MTWYIWGPQLWWIYTDISVKKWCLLFYQHDKSHTIIYEPDQFEKFNTTTTDSNLAMRRDKETRSHIIITSQRFDHNWQQVIRSKTEKITFHTKGKTQIWCKNLSLGQFLTSAARSVQYFSDWWHVGLSSKTSS